MFTIRLTTLEDVSHLPAIERSGGAAFRALPGLEWIADGEVQSEALHRSLTEGGVAWVAVDDADRPVGFVNGEVVDGDLHIWELSVRHDLQGRGLGGALMAEAIGFARRGGFDAVTLTTFREVPWNEPFYRRLGFVTLADDQLTDRLRAILADEIAAGLPGAQRCAMAMMISAG